MEKDKILLVRTKPQRHKVKQQPLGFNCGIMSLERSVGTHNALIISVKYHAFRENKKTGNSLSRSPFILFSEL